jgi:molecular chaperone GrpE
MFMRKLVFNTTRFVKVPSSRSVVYQISNRKFSSSAEPPKSEQEAVNENDNAAQATNGKSSEGVNLENEVKQLKDQLLRAYADIENTRRIAQRDVENTRAYANTSFAKALLEVADDLERAMSVVPANKKNTGDQVFDNLVIGIEMTEKNLQKVLKQFGVVKYGAVGDKFDPNLHDALFQVPDATKDPNTVAQIVQNGYKIKERVLRPAQVGATVKPDA